MMKIEPVITEKSLNLAKEGKYTFWVGKGLNKSQIKNLVEKLFDVNVVSVATINLRSEKKRTMTGEKRVVKPRKKAVVTLKEKEKIELFEESKK